MSAPAWLLDAYKHNRIVAVRCMSVGGVRVLDVFLRQDDGTITEERLQPQEYQHSETLMALFPVAEEVFSSMAAALYVMAFDEARK